MTVPDFLDSECLLTTDGEIAVINLESARRRSWNRFWENPLLDGRAETVIEHEQLTAQFVGDLTALDRLGSLVNQLIHVDAASPRTAFIRAKVASMMHCFDDARRSLAQAELGGMPPADIERLRLNIDQACGVNLDKVLERRREIASQTRQPEDWVALGSLLADLGEFADAAHAYGQALRSNRDVSPFPVAWACFQLGVLFGELVPNPQPNLAAQWYQRALKRLPSYAKARVHLAQIHLSSGQARDAEELLIPLVSSGDPEVHWRLAETMAFEGKSGAELQMQAARSGFESLLERYPLAFADHAAEFYAGSGNDHRRALDLARANVANRPTRRAIEQAHAIALSAGDTEAASEFLSMATRRRDDSTAFRPSSSAVQHLEKGAAV